MPSVEYLLDKQEGKCAECKSYEMTTEDQGGMMCHKCNKLYCKMCYYVRKHYNHNLEMWD